MGWLKRILRPGSRIAREPAATPDPEEWLRNGYDCESRGDVAGAERLYRRILEHAPADAEAHFYLGRIAAWDRREEEAITLFQKAAELVPREATYLGALGEALIGAKRYAEAIGVLRAAVALLPEATAIRNNYAVALIELGRRDEALVELERLCAELPDVAQLHFNLAGIRREYGRTDEAIEGYRRALKLRPDDAPTYSNLLLQLNYSANLDGAAIFEEHRGYGERFARRYLALQPDSAWPRRLRVGYVSPDFRAHSVAYFIEPILANHDRGRFEVFCYHTLRRKDAVTDRLRGFAEHWLDSEDLSDAELAARINADRIDILVDLAGHTSDNRLQMFAMKPAPVQATYLGYPNTTGLGAMDYHIADAITEPQGAEQFNVERLARLPASYFCYRPAPDCPAVALLPAAAAGAPTFGCFNHFPKLSRPFLEAAARVVSAVPGSRLVLKSRPLSIPDVAKAVRSLFEQSGIDPARIELRGWEAGVKDHLSIYGTIDVALDSFPYNGATTTCEALWMGVPVVTLVGDRHAARVGSSLLNALGLGELVAHGVDEYVAISARLASDRARLAEFRGGLRERMRRSPLMDEAGFTRALERIYLEMWENRSIRELSPGPDGQPVASLLALAHQSKAERNLIRAEASCREILRREPGHQEALALLWDLSFESEAPGAAVDALMKAIAADGGVASSHYMLGCSLQAQGKIGDAVESFRRAIEIDPALAKAHNNLGCILEAAGDLGGAVGCYREAIRHDPKLAHALYNLGNAYKQQGDAAQAIDCIQRALAIEPAHADWRCNLGDLQHGRLRLDEAIASFRAALATDPAYARAYSNLGAALTMLGRVEEAAENFRKALRLRPDAEDEARLLQLAHYAEPVDATTSFQNHREWAQRHGRTLVRATVHPGRTRGVSRRLNVGYVSPHFVRHPAACFIEPVLAAHDRNAFSVYCYSNAGQEDEVTRRLRALGGQWREVSASSDADLADRIRADGIDILVDLAGHAGGGRLMAFARKPAPVQVTWLRYPDTTGMDTMDYRLTDSIADPPGLTERFYTEKLIRLPQGFLCYAPPEEAPDAEGASTDRNAEVTFACFNDLAKLTPRMNALWSDLLRRLPGSRLLLKSRGLVAESARLELRARFLAAGIDAERLDLLPADPTLAQHLALYRRVDIALDAHPYNGTATTCEALWMGVPVVTLAGETHASRVGASILSRVGLQELIATTPQQYVEIALRLAADLATRRSFRAGMRARMRASPLLDAHAFCRALETAYREMWAKA